MGEGVGLGRPSSPDYFRPQHFVAVMEGRLDCLMLHFLQYIFYNID